MKIKIISILVSLIVIPLFAIGQYVGLFIGQILNWFFNYFIAWGPFSGPTFWTELLPYIISGGLAGYISALTISKIYKNYDLNFVMIIPSFLTLIVLYYVFTKIGENGWSFDGVKELAQMITTIAAYYISLKEKDF